MKKSKKQEKEIAAQVGGRTRPGSGNKWFAKHDVGAPGLLVEAKTTDSKSYSIKLDYLKGFVQKAREEGKIPMFVIDFAGEARRFFIFAEEDVDFEKKSITIQFDE